MRCCRRGPRARGEDASKRGPCSARARSGRCPAATRRRRAPGCGCLRGCRRTSSSARRPPSLMPYTSHSVDAQRVRRSARSAVIAVLVVDARSIPWPTRRFRHARSVSRYSNAPPRRRAARRTRRAHPPLALERRHRLADAARSRYTTSRSSTIGRRAGSPCSAVRRPGTAREVEQRRCRRLRRRRRTRTTDNTTSRRPLPAAARSPGPHVPHSPEVAHTPRTRLEPGCRAPRRIATDDIENAPVASTSVTTPTHHRPKRCIAALRSLHAAWITGGARRVPRADVPSLGVTLHELEARARAAFAHPTTSARTRRPVA